MKKLLLITVLVTLFFGCKKNNSIPGDQLEGRWEYRGTACYCAYPNGVPNNKAGNGDIYLFADGNYKHMQNGQVVKSGTYTISADVLNGQAVSRITYDGVTTPTNGFSLPFFKITDGTKLTFFGTVPAASDGVEMYYERL